MTTPEVERPKEQNPAYEGRPTLLFSDPEVKRSTAAKIPAKLPDDPLSGIAATLLDKSSLPQMKNTFSAVLRSIHALSSLLKKSSRSRMTSRLRRCVAVSVVSRSRSGSSRTVSSSDGGVMCARFSSGQEEHCQWLLFGLSLWLIVRESPSDFKHVYEEILARVVRVC